MSPEQFIATWKNNPLTEKAGTQAHFDDLCDLLGVGKPRDPDNYCFERGAKKSMGGDGWTDVWKRGHFGWESQKTGRDLYAALKQRTLTNLDNARPAWLDLAHQAPDRAAAYGWSDDSPEKADEEILRRLLALNLERADAPR